MGMEATMIRRTSLRALSSAVLFALLVTAIHPQPAFADEGTPPPDPVGETTSPTGDAALAEAPATAADEATPAPDVSSDAVASEEVSSVPSTEPTEEAPDASEAIPSDDASASDEAADASTVDLLAELPDGTTVAVVDAQGEPVPLVSNEAETIVAGGDPIWCPASVKAPTPLANGCTNTYDSFQNLLDDLPTHQAAYPSDGVIWFADNYDSGAVDLGLNFTLNGGSTFATMSNFKLTLRGGWSGDPGSKVITPLDPENLLVGTEFNGRLAILNWNNDVTLSDIEFTGTSGTYALQVTQATNSPGSITLTRVVSHNNTAQGAFLDSHSGTGKVSVSASQFNDNSLTGLTVNSKGAITLADVVASGNGDNGAYLFNGDTDATGAITLTGASTFNENDSYGLIAESNGVITANDLTARDNGIGSSYGSGVDLRNDNTASAASPGIKLTGMNVFTGNYDAGLVIQSYGAIALNSIYANSNLHSSGVSASNTGTTAAAMPVTITGTNSMRYNGYDGLSVYSTGKITLNNLTANGNDQSGASLINTYGSYVSDVVLTGANAFHDNANYGLYLESDGAISAANLAADRNGSYGAYLYNSDAATAKAVTLTGSNTFHANASTNLQIQSKGAITVSNLTASGSTSGSGAGLYNNTATTPQKVTLSGTNVFEDNYTHGLWVTSKGAISTSNLSATGNGILASSGHGAHLDNSIADPDSAQPVTLTGISLTSGNYSTGLWIQSKGNITAANVTSSGSINDQGARLYNVTLEATGGITLTGTNIFNENHTTGLGIESSGLIKLNNLTASGNVDAFGAVIVNTDAAADAPKDILLTGTNVFNDNYSDGVYLRSDGAITLSSVSASGNGTGSGSGNGLYADNSSGALPKAITLSGSYSLVGNDGFGLYTNSLGAIKVNNLTASENSGMGAYFYNASVAAVGGVTLTGATTLRDNGTYGMTVDSRGAVSAANLAATGNGSFGVYLVNTHAAADAGAATVTFSGTNVFSDNGSQGLYISTLRAVTLSNVTASGNLGALGAEIYNFYANASGGVTLSGANRFEDNRSAGLLVRSKGAITVSAVTASGNGTGGAGGGISLDNYNADPPQAIKLTGTNVFYDNHGTGLYAYSKGAITTSSLTASRNINGFGADLGNSDGTAGVTLTGTNTFEDNGYGGLNVVTKGAISLSSVTANRNGATGGYSGALLWNHGGATLQPIKLTGTNTFNDNQSRGLDVQSVGAITISNLTASRNGSHGASLVNNFSSSATGSVTLSGTNVFDDNNDVGLRVLSYGAIAVNSVTANGNYYGADLQNTGGATPQAIKITGTNAFHENDSQGLHAVSAGAISANNLLARGNASGSGASLSGVAGVTLTGTNLFNDNSSRGLDIVSSGAVSLANVTADNNGNRGISITGPASSITVTCASVTNNGSNGLWAETSGLLRLIGHLSSGNGGNDSLTYGSLSVTRACP
jgi:putative surface-exposed virulence protein